MNSKSINRNGWALTLSLYLGVIGYPTFSAQAADAPKAAEKQEKVLPGEGRGSGALICKRPATPAHNVGVDRCHGNWTPVDNTNNWTYQASQGPDHFIRKNGQPGDRSCMKCPNGGTIQRDFKGLEDWCVNYVAAVTAATTTPSCPSGYSWNGNICTRPAIPAHWVDVSRCHGNWTPLDNTNNWTYQASQGPDHFIRNDGKPGDRSCMKCPIGAALYRDFKGLEDWCVNSVAAVTAATTAGMCPAGFILGPP